MQTKTINTSISELAAHSSQIYKNKNNSMPSNPN